MAKVDKFEKIYHWRKNKSEKYRRVPQKIYNDREKGLTYNVDVAIPIGNGMYKIYEDTSVTLSFIGHERIAYWRRSINSYQASFDFGEVA